MVIALSIAGFVVLVAIVWCMRTMRKGFTTLDQNKEMWRSRIKQDEIQLLKDQSEITASEQNTFLEAAVHDLLRLDGLTASVTRDAQGIHITSERGTWIITYSTRTQAAHGHHAEAPWLLITQEGVEKFPSIQALMQTFEELLRGKERPQTDFLASLRRGTANRVPPQAQAKPDDCKVRETNPEQAKDAPRD